METKKALIPMSKEYSLKIKKLRKGLFLKEIELEKTVYEYLALEASIKNFYKNYYLKKLGNYIVLLESLKNRVLGFKEAEFKSNKEEKEVFSDVNEVKIKKLYRKLARLYHPDNFDCLDKEDKEFYDFRMGEINSAFEKRDLKTLERIEKRAQVELDYYGLSPLKRIEQMQEEVYIAQKMIEIYKEKKKMLSCDEIAVLMFKQPDERDKEIEEIKERFVSEIKTYQRICARLGY